MSQVQTLFKSKKVLLGTAGAAGIVIAIILVVVLVATLRNTEPEIKKDEKQTTALNKPVIKKDGQETVLDVESISMQASKDVSGNGKKSERTPKPKPNPDPMKAEKRTELGHGSAKPESEEEVIENGVEEVLESKSKASSPSATLKVKEKQKNPPSLPDNTKGEKTTKASGKAVGPKIQKSKTDQDAKAVDKKPEPEEIKKPNPDTSAAATKNAIEATIKLIDNDPVTKSFFSTEEPDVLKQINEAKSIEEVLGAISSTFKKHATKLNGLAKLHIGAFANYLQAKGGNATAIDALTTVQNSLNTPKDKLSAKEKFQQGLAWGSVLLNVNEESDLTLFTKSIGKSPVEVEALWFPYGILTKPEELKKLRNMKEQTEKLLEAKSEKEFINNLSQLDPQELTVEFETYIKSLELLFRDLPKLSAVFGVLSSLPLYSGDKDKLKRVAGEMLRRELKEIPLVPEENADWQIITRGLCNIAEQYENEGDLDEAGKWREFILRAEVILGLGLPDNKQYEHVFTGYKQFDTDGRDDDALVPFLNVLYSLEPKYRKSVKYFLGGVLEFDSFFIIEKIFESLDTFDADKIARNLTNVKSVEEKKHFQKGKNFYYLVPELLTFLDSDLAQKLCREYKPSFDIPSNFKFKTCAEFNSFVASQNRFIAKAEGPGAHFAKCKEALHKFLEEAKPPSFIPNIGFASWNVGQHIPEQWENLIAKYKALAEKMKDYDPVIATKMKDHVEQLEKESK